MGELVRAFIAANIPGKIRAEISSTLSQKIPEKKFKVVEEGNLHITLRFLGYLNKEKVREISEKMKALESRGSFTAKLEGIGEFNGRVIWVGISKGNMELGEISSALGEITGVKDERFHAHVTLARNRGADKKEAKELVGKLNECKFSREFTIGSIELMKSELTPKGPVYSPISSVTFSRMLLGS